MSDPYIGEIRMVGFNFAPQGWAACDGQALSIAQYSALFNLIGTTYGGDGQNTFAVPNLGGRVPMGQGSGSGLTPRALGTVAGSENVTLTQAQIPQHTHALLASTSAGTQDSPINGIYASPPSVLPYRDTDPAIALGPMNPAGGSQAHNNMQPFLTVTFIICLDGNYPTQS